MEFATEGSYFVLCNRKNNNDVYASVARCVQQCLIPASCRSLSVNETIGGKSKA